MVQEMTVVVTRAHRLSVARAWEGDDLSAAMRRWVDGIPDGEHSQARRFDDLAQLVADAEPSPEAVAHGRALLLEIGGDSEECWQQNDKTFENAAPLADALARVVGYPERDEDGECFYPEPA